jgi:diguanylate cyclase (GGDEF)-like protein
MTTPIDEVARDWLSGIARAGFVPGTRAAARDRLRDLLCELIDAIRADTFDADRGRRAGRLLVAYRMSAPGVAGATMRVLAQRMPALLDGDSRALARLPELLGEVAAGFAEASREAALTGAESLNRAEKLTWHQAQLELQTRLQHALLLEAVTDLPNRARLRAYLREQIESAGPDRRLGVCMLRIEEFTDLNQALGHDAGDALLAAIGMRLEAAAARSGYFLAHLGDQRFVLVVPDPSGADDVVKAAEQAGRALAQSFDLAGYAPAITAKAGLVEGLTTRADPGGWLRDASVALGWARADDTPYAVFQPARAERDLYRQRLTAAMPAALEQGEFAAHFQPLYRLTDHSVAGFEALARWNRADGVLSPAEFVPVAERTGLIARLGRYMLEQSCAQAASWHRQGHGLLVSVNLSPRQLTDRGLVASVADILDRTGLPPEHLQLEITESAALDGHHQVLRELAALGVRLAIDDFGTGYSSLALLPHLPIRGVKLAAEFLLALDPRDIRSTTVLRHTIAFCRDLGITVTGEGIETAAQERRLRDLGCHLGQGFLFARPVPAAEATRILAADGFPEGR